MEVVKLIKEELGTLILLQSRHFWWKMRVQIRQGTLKVASWSHMLYTLHHCPPEARVWRLINIAPVQTLLVEDRGTDLTRNAEGGELVTCVT